MSPLLCSVGQEVGGLSPGARLFSDVHSSSVGAELGGPAIPSWPARRPAVAGCLERGSERLLLTGIPRARPEWRVLAHVVVWPSPRLGRGPLASTGFHFVAGEVPRLRSDPLELVSVNVLGTGTRQIRRIRNAVTTVPESFILI